MVTDTRENEEAHDEQVLSCVLLPTTIMALMRLQLRCNQGTLPSWHTLVQACSSILPQLARPGFQVAQENILDQELTNFTPAQSLSNFPLHPISHNACGSPARPLCLPAPAAIPRWHHHQHHAFTSCSPTLCDQQPQARTLTAAGGTAALPSQHRPLPSPSLSTAAAAATKTAAESEAVQASLPQGESIKTTLTPEEAAEEARQRAWDEEDDAEKLTIGPEGGGELKIPSGLEVLGMAAGSAVLAVSVAGVCMLATLAVSRWIGQVAQALGSQSTEDTQSPQNANITSPPSQDATSKSPTKRRQGTEVSAQHTQPTVNIHTTQPLAGRIAGATSAGWKWRLWGWGSQFNSMKESHTQQSLQSFGEGQDAGALSTKKRNWWRWWGTKPSTVQKADGSVESASTT